MLMVVLVVLSYGLIIGIDTYWIYKRQNRRDFYVNAGLCFLSFIIALLLALDVKLPSPSNWIKWIVEELIRINH